MLTSQDSNAAIDQITRTTQIIIGALIAGVTIFLLIAAYIVYSGALFPAGAVPGNAGAGAANPAGAAGAANKPAGGLDLGLGFPLLTYMAAGIAAVMLPLSFTLPGIIAAQSLRGRGE